MWIKHLMLAIVGWAAGVGASAGTFAFVIVVGVIPRILARTRYGEKTILAENMIVLGGISGCIVSSIECLNLLGLNGDTSGLPQIIIVLLQIFGHFLLCVYGFCAGIFVGCISIALAEILNTFPILFRRLHLKRALQWIMVAMAMGKFSGAMFYFLNNLKSE